MVYRIWQLPQNSDRLFGHYDADYFTLDGYCCIWWGKLEDAKRPISVILEQIFETLNVDLPEHFAGHSLSISDVVEIRDEVNKTCTFYYCDDLGWAQIKNIRYHN